METSLLTIGVLFRGDSMLLQSRTSTYLNGMWEFPGGKVEQGETYRDALAREWMEEVGMSVEVRELIGEYRFSLPHAPDILGQTYRVVSEGKPLPLLGQKFRWLSYPEIQRLGVQGELVPSFDGLWEALLAECNKTMQEKEQC